MEASSIPFRMAPNKMSSSQLLAYKGGILFTEVMTENVYFLTKNYRVDCKKFKDILSRVRVGRPNLGDAKRIMDLNMHHYASDKEFVKSVEDGEKTMWLFTNNADKDAKNVEKLVDYDYIKCQLMGFIRINDSIGYEPKPELQYFT